MDEERHHDQRQRGDDDSDRRLLGCAPLEQGADGTIGDVSGEQQKAAADDPQRLTLGRLASPLVGIPAQPPECRQAAGDLDRRVEAEADQRDASGEEPGDQRDEAFERIPRDGDVLQPAAVTSGRGPQLLGHHPPVLHHEVARQLQHAHFLITPHRRDDDAVAGRDRVAVRSSFGDARPAGTHEPRPPGPGRQHRGPPCS